MPGAQHNIMDKKNIKKILLVCTGNSCRSIMAEGYLNKRLKELGKDITVESVGTSAVSGLKPTLETIKSMNEISVDVTKYKSSALTREMLNSADIILVMEPIHRERIRTLDPFLKDKIFYLKQFKEGNPKDNVISDPIGKPLEFYRKVLNMIMESVEGFLKWLEE